MNVRDQYGEEIINCIADGDKQGKDGGIASLRRVKKVRNDYKQI